jgi:hypothetical protein
MCEDSRVRRSKTSTPKGNGLLTPRPAPTRESESFAPNRTHRKGTFRSPKGTAAKQRQRLRGVGCRKPHEIQWKRKNAERDTLGVLG